MKITPLIVLLTAAILFPADASFPEKSSVKEYYEDAQVVAYVQIESGEIDRVGNDQCGVSYQATVLRAFKGITAKTLSFAAGPSVSGVEVGKNYLVFASEQHGVDRRKEQQYYSMPDDFLDKCKTDATFLQPRILIGEQFHGPKLYFIVPERIVAFPESIPSSPGVSVLGSDAVLDPKYVDQEDAFAYLQSIAGGT